MSELGTSYDIGFHDIKYEVVAEREPCVEHFVMDIKNSF